MSRLVAPVTHEPAMAGGPGDSGGYLDRVVKYVPTEIVAGYVALDGAATGLPESWRYRGLIATFVLCLVLTPIYLNSMAKPGQPRR